MKSLGSSFLTYLMICWIFLSLKSFGTEGCAERWRVLCDHRTRLGNVCRPNDPIYRWLWEQVILSELHSSQDEGSENKWELEASVQSLQVDLGCAKLSTQKTNVMLEVVMQHLL